jgi:hypothetical protein
MTATLRRHNHGCVAWDLNGREPVGDWRDLAACRGADPELFAHARTRPVLIPNATESYAMRMCQRCPVQAECYDNAADPKLVWPTNGVIRAGLFWPLALNPGMGRPGTPYRRPPARDVPPERACRLCELPLDDNAPAHKLYCSDVCRRSASRQRQVAADE